MQFLTDDDEAVMLHYTGLVLATDAFNRAAESNGTTDFGDQTMRMALHFETGAKKYAWLINICSSPKAGSNEVS